jgi:hypothetical protein
VNIANTISYERRHTVQSIGSHLRSIGLDTTNIKIIFKPFPLNAWLSLIRPSINRPHLCHLIRLHSPSLLSSFVLDPSSLHFILALDVSLSNYWATCSALCETHSTPTPNTNTSPVAEDHVVITTRPAQKCRPSVLHLLSQVLFIPPCVSPLARQPTGDC